MQHRSLWCIKNQTRNGISQHASERARMQAHLHACSMCGRLQHAWAHMQQPAGGAAAGNRQLCRSIRHVSHCSRARCPLLLPCTHLAVNLPPFASNWEEAARVCYHQVALITAAAAADLNSAAACTGAACCCCLNRRAAASAAAAAAAAAGTARRRPIRRSALCCKCCQRSQQQHRQRKAA